MMTEEHECAKEAFQHLSISNPYIRGKKVQGWISLTFSSSRKYLGGDVEWRYDGHVSLAASLDERQGAGLPLLTAQLLNIELHLIKLSHTFITSQG